MTRHLKDIPESLRTNASNLRHAMTKEERILWFDCLKEYPLRIRRQVIKGNYIVDFCCEKAKLIIELDGSQHYSPEEQIKDQIRTGYLEALGYKVLRFSNLEVHTYFKAVTDTIDREIRLRLKG